MLEPMVSGLDSSFCSASDGVQWNSVTAVYDYLSSLSDNTVPADNLSGVLQCRTGPTNPAAKFDEPIDRRDRARHARYDAGRCSFGA
jgi:hypothetical protein